MVIDKNTTMSDFGVAASLFPPEMINQLFERLKTRKTPETIAKKAVPENLNLLMWAQFAALSSLDGKTDESFFAPFEIILDLKKDRLLDCKLFDIFGFLLFVKNELERIAKLFESIKPKPTSEEIQAGINKLNFGLFGTLDWYARRMGFTDHQEAEKMPLIRIFQCMKIDNETAQFEKRLREIINKKYKIRH